MSTNDKPGQRILFAGTPDFSVPALEALITAGHQPLAVLTQPDRPAGRGRKLVSSPVKACAASHGIPVLQPETLRGEAIQKTLAEFEPDLMVVVAYGLILPQEVLDIPRYGCWNIHASILPRWRGAAPIQRAIEAGDSNTGVCIMQMEAGLDTGPVYLCEETAITADETGGSLHDRLAELGAEALMKCIRALQSDSLDAPQPQDEARASYATKLLKSEAEINWNESAAHIERKVRAFNPWPVAWCELNGQRLRVWKADVADTGLQAAPGTVLAASETGIDIATAEGALRLREIQRAGGRRMPVAEFLRAHSVGADA